MRFMVCLMGVLGLGAVVSRIVHIHGRQVLTTEQLNEVTDGYRDASCPEGESICAD